MRVKFGLWLNIVNTATKIEQRYTNIHNLPFPKIMITPQTEITIKVPMEIARAYNLATEAERQKISTKIAFFLQSSTPSRKEAIQKLHQTMDDIGQKAIARGLTPEILESILNDDE